MVFFKLMERTIGLVSTLVLARLLIPEDFGLVAMAMAILGLVELLTAFSFDIALIQNSNADRSDYDTAWTFNVLFGVAIALAIVLLARPAALFYDEPRVALIMCVLALSPLIGGFANIGVVAFQKELTFDKEFRLGLFKKLVALVVTVAVAISVQNYWALIAGTITSALVGVGLSYLMHPYRPRFSLQARGQLFNFSKWLLLNNLVISLVLRLPDLIIGRIAGPRALGIYSLAFEISNLPTSELVMPISRAVFPGYTMMASDLSKLRAGYLDVLSLIAMIAIPAGLGIALLAEPVVYCLLGAKWADAIPVINVLALYGIVRACTSNIGSVFLALGHTRLIACLAGVSLLFLIPSMLWGVSTAGPVGAAWAFFGVVLLMTPVYVAVVMAMLRLTLADILGAIWRPAISGLIMTILLLQLRVLLDDIHYVQQLALFIPIGAACYSACILMLWRMSGQKYGAERILVDWLIERVHAFKARGRQI